MCLSDISKNTKSFISRRVETFAGNIYTLLITLQGALMRLLQMMSRHPYAIQVTGTLSKVKEVPRYQEIVAPRRRPTHPPVLTYSLTSRQLASVHGSQHSMNLHPSKFWKLGRSSAVGLEFLFELAVPCALHCYKLL